MLATLECCNGSLSVIFEHPIFLHRWYHFCIAANLKNRKVVSVYSEKVHIPVVDEAKVNRDQGLQVAEGQRAVVGQEMDSLQGDFDETQFLDGQIADFRFYNVSLDVETMKSFTSCVDDLVEDTDPLLSMTNGKLRAVGSVAVTSILISEVCEEKTEYLFIFPVQTNIINSANVCKKLNGSLALPQNSETNKRLHDRFSNFSIQCGSAKILYYWIGTQLNESLQQWVHHSDGSSLSWNNFGTTSIDPWKKCAFVGDKKSTLSWYDSSCEEYIERCFACNFTSRPLVRIRGLCTHSLVDRKMYMNSNDNTYPRFDGEEHSQIVRQNGRWKLVSNIYKELQGTLLSFDNVITPLGRHSWDIKGDRCTGTKVQLLVTACGKEEYTCQDGTCINKELFCDTIINCPDESDEKQCSLVQVPDGYYKDGVPPHTRLHPLVLFFSINITSIRNFDLTSFTLDIDVVWHPLEDADERIDESK
ncbi:hypothetical protein E2C01_040827 [Portunus trituberculatus]|uniref:Uncharacterized protein n=1 Tax=Portunus trituberculatus TaxID=210409 RepID=A0A5B7FKT5_PORTR|nr:hypothetical protein [Portunus trituberculatus]